MNLSVLCVLICTDKSGEEYFTHVSVEKLIVCFVFHCLSFNGIN